MPAPNWDRAAELTQTNSDPGRKALSILGTLPWVNPDKSSDKDSKPSTPRGVCQPLKDPRTPSPHLDPATSPLGACGKARKTKLNLGFYRASLSPWTKKGKKKSPGTYFYLSRFQQSLFPATSLSKAVLRTVGLILSLWRNRLSSAFTLELVTLSLTLHYF